MPDIPDDTVYSSDPVLRAPRRFLAAATIELRTVPVNAWRMARRDLRARYGQTRLGYAWMVIPSLVASLTWVYLQSAGIIRFGDPGIPYLAYVLSGTMLWQVFTDALNAPLRRLSVSREMFTKARVPHETLMLSGLPEVLFGFAVRLAIVVVVLVLVGTPWSALLLLVPLGVAALLVLGLAIGVLLAPLGLLYDDVGQGLTVATGLWFFLTPVIYPWPRGGAGAWLVGVNPVTPLLTTTRGWLTGAPTGTPWAFVAVAAGAVVVLCIGLFGYRLARPHLVARL